MENSIQLLDINPITTYLATTALGGVAGYFVRILIEHRLAKSLSETERYFAAAQRFRDSINEAMTMFQPTHYTWSGCNKDAIAMRHFIRTIDVATREFAQFKGIKKMSFANKWQETKNYCDQVLVHEISSGDPDRSNIAKNVFLNHVSELISHAKPS